MGDLSCKPSCIALAGILIITLLALVVVSVLYGKTVVRSPQIAFSTFIPPSTLILPPNISLPLWMNKRIPKVFIRTGPWEWSDLPEPFRENLLMQESLNPGFSSLYFSDAQCRLFITECYPQWLGAYDSLIPGAFKADLWRLMILYIHGGIYNDIGHVYIRPVSDFFNVEVDEFVSVIDFKWGIHNALMAAYPQHPIILALLNFVCLNVVTKSMGINPLDITGPMALGRAFKRMFGKKDLDEIPSGMSVINGKRMRFLDLRINNSATIGVSSSGKILLQTKCPDYEYFMYTSRDKIPYDKAWRTNKVFSKGS